MRRLLSLVMTMAVLLSFSGCVGSGDTEKSTTEPSSSVSNETDYISKFASKHGVSVKFARSMDKAIQKISDKYNRKFTIKQAYNFKQVEDWAEGKRYHIYLDYEYVLYVYEQDGEVVSIRRTNGDFVYKK